MKKKISIILSVILLLGCMPLNAFAENVFNWVVEPSLVYDYVYGFEDGLSGVRVGGDELKRTMDDGTKFYNNNYHGVININGKEIIPVSPDNPTFAWSGNMEDGYAWKTDNGNTLVYNSDGELTLTLPYDDAYYWRDGFFIASTNENIMLMDMEGNIQLSVQKLYDNYSIYNWGKSFWEVVQRSSDYSEYRYDLYNYDGECVLENIDDISRTYASGSYDNNGKYYEAYYIKKNGQYAIINDDVQILTDFNYDAVEILDGGLIKVTRNEKYGLIDGEGRTIFSCEYDSIEKKIYDDKVYYLITGGDYQGLIRSNGDIIAYPEYLYIYYSAGVFHANKKRAEDGRIQECDYISEEGNILYYMENPSYRVTKLSDNYYSTPEGIVDKYGNFILYWHVTAANMLDNDRIWINTYDQASWVDDYYIYSITSDTIKELTEYDSYSVIKNVGVLIVGRGSSYTDRKYGLIDVNENEILPCEYDSISQINNNNFLSIKKNGKYGIVDYNGNILVPCEFDSLNAEYSWGSYYKYKIKGENDGVDYYGWIDENNKLVVPCEYDSVYRYDNGYQVKKDDKYGIIGLDGNVIVQARFDGAYFMSDKKYIEIKKDNKYGVLDLNGDPCIPPLYDSVGSGGIDLFAVEKNGKHGILDASGNDIIPIEYDDLIFTNSGGGGSRSYYSDYKWCQISKDIDGDGVEEHGLADTSGNIFLDCIYSDIVISDDIIIVKDKNGLWGWGKYEYKMPITISSEINDGIIEVSITNDDNLTGTMIAAYYKDNALVKIDKRDITDANGSINFEIPNANIDYYKIFVWDDVGSLQPLSHTAQGQLDVEYTEPEPADEPKDTDESKHETDFSNVTKLNIDGTIYEVIGRKKEILMDIDTISELTGYEYEWDNDTQITFTKEGASFSFILNTYDIIQHGKLEEDWKLDEKFQQINGKYYLQFLKGPVSLEAFTGDYTSGDDTMYITLTK